MYAKLYDQKFLSALAKEKLAHTFLLEFRRELEVRIETANNELQQLRRQYNELQVLLNDHLCES